MSSLRINHNISAMNAHRNMAVNDTRMSRTMEHLSSGMKINRAADGPAALVISEQMRSQVAGLKQAVMNSETAVSMVQTTEAALSEVNNLLVSMRQLAIHASNTGANDDVMLQADQAELINALDSIDRIAQNTQFGTKFLLDGTNGAAGVATGEELTFRGATESTMQSPDGGYKVDIKSAATQASVRGKRALTQDVINRGETLTLIQGGKSASYTTKPDDTPEIVLNKLQNSAKKFGLELEVSLDSKGRINVNHKNYGSDETFDITSTTGGILSLEDNVPLHIDNGKDVVGTIGGKVSFGKGQFLEGAEGSGIDGLTVHYGGQLDPVLAEQAVSRVASQVAVQQELIGDPSEIPLMRDGKIDLNAFAEANGPEKAIQLEMIYDEADYNRQEIIAAESIGEVGRISLDQNSLKFQIGSNYGQTAFVNIPSTSTGNLGQNIDNTSGFKNLRDLNITTFDGAQDAIKLIDNSVTMISDVRAKLGALQKNTLESNISSLQVAKEALTNAESVIRDADMAHEMSLYTRDKILLQSSTSMLGQANQSAQNVLSLLQ